METIEALGKYEIKRPLGRGAMGTVYEGWDPIIARRVAIKTVKLPDNADPETEEALARFRREAQAAGRLTHPNIVAVFDYGETNDLAYIVMEYVDGPSLKNLLDKQERFALADTMRVMEDVLTGLQFSHERGVVHRDIKPANVMLTGGGQAKIADFGIARIESSSMTQAGTVLGTPAYMSPEQFMGQVVDARSDIYSSGVLLYQLLTGERPFEGGMSAIMHKALNTEPPAPSQLSVTAPPSFDAVVRQAMAKRPEDRFASAKVFFEAMRTALANQSTPAVSEDEATMIATAAVPPPPPRPAAKVAPPPSVAVPAAAPTKGSNLPIMAGAAVVLLGLVGGGAWWYLQAPTPVPSPQPVIGTAAPPPTPVVASVTPPAKPPPQETKPPTVATTTPIIPPPQPPPTPVVQPPSNPPPVQANPTTVIAPPVQPPSSTPPPDQVNPTSVIAPPVRPGPSPTVQPSNPPSVQAAPPPPVIPPVQPSNQQLAMVTPDTLRRQIAQWVAGRSCAILGGDLAESGIVTLNGYASEPSIQDLRQGLTSFVSPGQIEWRVTGVDPVFCPALNTLHPIAASFGASGGPRMGLQMADGKTRLRDGEQVKVRLVMPDFPSRLRVDYIAHDGAVQHLYPQLADAKDGVAADPPRVYAPGEPVNLGHPAWRVSEPYGTDMIIAVASSEPLFERPRPANAESAEAYLRDLQAAIDSLRQRGARLAGAAVTLEALPR